MFEDLAFYPEDIANTKIKILRLDRKIRKAQRQLDIATTAIEQAIALDPDCKNDQQRKAKRLEQMQSPDYLTLVDAVAEASDRKSRLEIELQRLRDEFSVLKLQFRDHIADKEIAA